jgi:hypothetical protein
MDESGQSERQRAAGTAGLRLSFKYFDLQAGLGKNDRGGKAVGAGPDHDGALHPSSLRSVM